MKSGERAIWITGGVALAVAALGWAIEPRVFAYGWLAALIFWVGFPLGGMALHPGPRAHRRPLGRGGAPGAAARP